VARDVEGGKDEKFARKINKSTDVTSSFLVVLHMVTECGKLLCD
jgi:hypothetical protein